MDDGVLVTDADDLRRGARLRWTWLNEGAGARALERGLRPAGHIVTQADRPGIPHRIGLAVNDDPDWIIDPCLAARRGRPLHFIGADDLPKVLNARKTGKDVPGAVYIGRPGPWGNPIKLERESDRDTVIEEYIGWLHGNPDFVDRVRRQLAGKDLICWCDPLACHGHVLRDIAAGAPLPSPPKRLQHDLFDISPE